MNLNSTGLGLGRFWPIFLQNDKSRTLHVAVKLEFCGGFEREFEFEFHMAVGICTVGGRFEF